MLLVCVPFTYVQIGYWKDSLSLWEHTLHVTTDNAQALNNYGEALWEAERPHAALKQFDAYVRLRPSDVRGYRHRGYVFSALSLTDPDPALTDRAVENYETALSLDRNLPDVYVNLGSIRLDRNQARAAEESFQAALLIDPSEGKAKMDIKAVQAKAWYNLGRIRVGERNFADAETCFNKAIRLEAEDMGYHVARADALAELGNFPEALAIIDRVLPRIGPGAAPKFVGAVQERKRCFEKGRPYRPD